MVMFMKEEGTIKQKRKKNTSVNKQKKVTKKIEEIDSSELLDQILAKKKAKKNKTTSQNTKSKTVKKNTSNTKKDKVVKKNEIDNSALLDEILAKKKAKKAKLEEKKKKQKGLLVDKNEVNNKVVKEILITDSNKKLRDEQLVKDTNKEELKKVIKSSAPEYPKYNKSDEILESLEKKETKIYDFEEESTPIVVEPKKSKIDYYKNNKKSKYEKKTLKKKKNNKKNYILLMLSFLIISLLIFIIMTFKTATKDKTIFKDNTEELEKQAKELEIKRQKEYDECLNLSYNENDNSNEVNEYVNELNNYLSNYSVSLIYEDLERGFTFSYNKDVVYYAASTIKSLDALYIYQKAYNNELNLDETMTYTADFKWGSSKFMSTHQYGDQITLRDLVKYAVMVSDNSAHQMLVKYIGYSNLKAFGQSLGAQYTLTSSDNFGNLSANDGIVYMKAINNFINQSGELGQELKSYFIQAEQNDLELPDLQIQAAHKYGQYSEFYHDIGIVYDEHPYVIAILTKEGNKDFESIVKDINNHIYKLHTMYNENRKNYCHGLVYDK